jgi:hypothetical protein
MFYTYPTLPIAIPTGEEGGADILIRRQQLVANMVVKPFVRL